MSTLVANKISKEKLRQFLNRLGSEAKEEATQVETTEYNWHEPHYFSSEQLVKLDAFAKSIEAIMADKFSGFCRSQFDVTITSITQHFADELLRQFPDNNSEDYYLAFGPDQENMCGFVGIPESTAVTWARQLLGDSGNEKKSDQGLSCLEESLLLDLTSALVCAFSNHDKRLDFHPAKSLVRGRLPFVLHSTEELCMISFGIQKAGEGDRSEAYLLIISKDLGPVVGKDTEAPHKFSAEEISEAILHHLEGMPVTVTAKLATTILTFEEMLNLRVDDVLLLDKKADQPIDLMIRGRTVYYGWPVKSAGKYAVIIDPAGFQKQHEKGTRVQTPK